MSTAVRERIVTLLSQHRIVLFMKGTPQAPRCGFSSRATGLLGSLGQPFHSVDVLADEEIRQGIKDFGNWPTIPQLYVEGELVGGSDIIAQMYSSGELHALLGAPAPDRSAPQIQISETAAQAIRAGMADDPGLALHLEIDGSWRAQFQLAPAEGHEIVASDQGIKVLMNPDTAQRARGMQIDWVESVQGSGLSVRLPAAPPPVQALQVEELQARLLQGSITVLDVRPEADRQRAPFSSGAARAQVLDQSSFLSLTQLPMDTTLAFLCHYGNSSRQAAEQFRNLGFTDVHNVEGGIDAWSQRIDPSIPRY